MRVRYTGDIPSAPPGYELFESGEVRDLTDEQAAYVLRNVWFVRADDDESEEDPTTAPEPAPAPEPETTQPQEG